LDTLLDILVRAGWGGFNALLEYLSGHVLTCLVPAFFIAGAIGVFISQASVLRYFGPQAKKPASYGVASVSGTVLAVCSCTVLPLFGGIYKRGAGIGPAIAFLYSGPAINVLAIVYTARLLGYELGLARAVGAILFSIVIGLVMAFIFRGTATKGDADLFAKLAAEPSIKPLWQQVLLLVVLVGVLVAASSQWWIVTGILLAGLGVVLWRYFTRREMAQWMGETGHFVKLIAPWLFGGVFVAGIITTFVPATAVGAWVGGNSILSNFIASFGGALMYFATLTEVPILKSFIDLGMGNGPALALLLAGPALSLPAMLVLRSIMGWKRTLSYVGLVVVMATFTGLIFGLITG